MKGFTASHPLRHFVQLATRWSSIARARVKLEIDHVPGVDNKWADALSRNCGWIQHFFPKDQRVHIDLSDLL
eukprot:8502191-Pyramimonas_sp.AAC.1